MPGPPQAAAVVGDKLVVVGGQDDKQLVKPTEVFDGESWTQAADLPTPREHLAAVSDGVYVYAVGGRNLSADENSAAFQRFNPASGTWDDLTDMPTPRGSYGAAIIDGRIVGRRRRGTDTRAGDGGDVRHHHQASGPRRRRSTPRFTARWSPLSGRRCTASVAPTGPHTKVRSRPSRRSTSPNCRPRAAARSSPPRAEGLRWPAAPGGLPRWGWRTCRTCSADAV